MKYEEDKRLFSSMVKKLVTVNNFSYIEASLKVCDIYDVDPRDIKEFIDEEIIIELKREFIINKMIKGYKINKINKAFKDCFV